MGQYTTHQKDHFALHLEKLHSELRLLYNACVVHFEMLKKVFKYCMTLSHPLVMSIIHRPQHQVQRSQSRPPQFMSQCTTMRYAKTSRRSTSQLGPSANSQNSSKLPTLFGSLWHIWHGLPHTMSRVKLYLRL